MVDKAINEADAAALGGAVSDIAAQLVQASRTLTDALSVFQAKLKDIPVVDLPPTVEVTGPASATVGDDLHYVAVVNDPENDPITGYIWFIDGNSVGQGNTFHWQPTTAGRFDLSVMVTEAAGNYTIKGMTVDIAARPVNQPPTVAIVGPATATVGQTFTYTANATDADGSVVRFEWTVNGAPATGTTSTVVIFGTEGTTTISCKVTDDKGATGQADLTVTVAPQPSTAVGVRVSLLKVGQQPDYVVPTGAGVIVLKPTDNLQAKIDAAANGATFVFTAGTYVLPGSGSNDAGLRPKQGQQFHGAPGSIITRNGGRGKAFIAEAGMGNVLLANLRIQDMVQGSQAETAAVTSLDAPGPYNEQPGGPSRNPGKGWTIRGCTITRCSAGIHAGTGTLIEDTDVSGCYGVGAKTWGEDVLIRRCRANLCNIVQEPGKAKVMPWGGSYDTYYESGGIKLWKGAGCVVEDVEANGNGGSGIWSDYGNAERYRPDLTTPLKYGPRVIRWCTTTGNYNSGVAIEMSDRIEVHHCLVQNNQDWDQGMTGRKPVNSNWTSGGIGVYNCPGAWIHHNTITGNDGGINLQFRPRGPIGWNAQPEQVPGPDTGVLGSVASCLVEDNIIDWTIVRDAAGNRVTGGGTTGIRQITDDDFPPYTHHGKAYLALYWSDIVWRRNIYRCTPGLSSALTDLTKPFMVPSAARTEWDFDRLNLDEWFGSGRS